MKKQKIFTASIIIFFFSVGGFILEYLVRAFLVSKFGDSYKMDAFLLATTIPLWVRNYKFLKKKKRLTILLRTFLTSSSFLPL